MMNTDKNDWFDPAFMPSIPEQMFSLPKPEAERYICRAPIALNVKAQLLRRLGSAELAEQAQAAFDALTKDMEGFLCVIAEIRQENLPSNSLFLGGFKNYEDFCSVPVKDDNSRWFTLHHYIFRDEVYQCQEIYDYYRGKLCWFVGNYPHAFAPIPTKRSI